MDSPDFTACPHWGKGGRYVLNAEGQRVPVIPEGVAIAEHPAAGTAEPMTAVEGDPLAVPEQPTKKGK